MRVLKPDDLADQVAEHRLFCASDLNRHELWIRDLESEVAVLRAKLEEGGEPRLLQTIRGVGYALREE